jgi:hypothetical protein
VAPCFNIKAQNFWVIRKNILNQLKRKVLRFSPFRKEYWWIYCPGMFMEGLRKPTKNFSWPLSGRDSNRTPPEEYLLLGYDAV